PCGTPSASTDINPSYILGTIPGAMGMIVSFSPELRTWILHNLDSGCAVADLVARMVDQKFEPGIARELVETFVHARAAGIDPPAAAVTLELAAAQYHYEMPRIAPGTRIHTS